MLIHKYLSINQCGKNSSNEHITSRHIPLTEFKQNANHKNPEPAMNTAPVSITPCTTPFLYSYKVWLVGAAKV